MVPTNTNRITSPVTGPLTVPASWPVDEPAEHDATHAPNNVPTDRRGHRVAVAVTALALLVGALLCAFTLPARAATLGGPTNNNGTAGSGVGRLQARSAAGEPGNSSGDLVFAGLCVAGILATAGGVLGYTVRTRRTLD
jgi:hypothetical protein